MPRNAPLRSVSLAEVIRTTLCIHTNMPFDARHFLARIITFLFRSIGIADTLRINNEKTRLFVPVLAATLHANQIFLKPARGRWADPVTPFYSKLKNIREPCAIWGIVWVASATDNRF